jgi:hypothetical protein
VPTGPPSIEGENFGDRPTTEAIASEIARLTQNYFPDLDLVCVQLTEGSNNEAVCMIKDRGPLLSYPSDDCVVSTPQVEHATASV